MVYALYEPEGRGWSSSSYAMLLVSGSGEFVRHKMRESSRLDESARRVLAVSRPHNDLRNASVFIRRSAIFSYSSTFKPHEAVRRRSPHTFLPTNHAKVYSQRRTRREGFGGSLKPRVFGGTHTMVVVWRYESRKRLGGTPLLATAWIGFPSFVHSWGCWICHAGRFSHK